MELLVAHLSRLQLLLRVKSIRMRLSRCIKNMLIAFASTIHSSVQSSRLFCGPSLVIHDIESGALLSHWLGRASMAKPSFPWYRYTFAETAE
jgi:hypothetical protein